MFEGNGNAMNGCLARRGGASAKEVGDVGVIALGGDGESRLAVVGGGVGIRAVGEEEFDDVEVAVRGSRKEGSVARAIAIVGTEAALEEPLHDFGVAGSDGGGEGVVAGAIGGDGVDVGALLVKVAGGIEMAKETGQGENRKTVRRKRLGQGRVWIDEVFDAFEIARSGRFVKPHCGARGKEEFADFAAAGIDGREKGGDTGFVTGGGEGGVGIEKRSNLREITGADGVEESFCVGHGRSLAARGRGERRRRVAQGTGSRELRSN